MFSLLRTKSKNLIRGPGGLSKFSMNSLKHCDDVEWLIYWSPAYDSTYLLDHSSMPGVNSAKEIIMELFLDNPKGIEKFAQSFTRLSENPDDWQAEIVNELYRQAPYVGDFEPTLIMNELDPEQRYGLGSVELKSRTAVNPRDEGTSEKHQGTKRVLIPVVVKNGKMFPMDVFTHNGKAQPLTETRLRKAMFRPELFEAASKRPGDQDMMNTLYPPHRSGGLGVGGNSMIGQQETAKMGSARLLIDAIHHTIKEADVKNLEKELNGDYTLRSTVLNNPATVQFFSKLAEPVKTLSGREMLKVAMRQIPPKVIQISKVTGGFLMKTANPGALLPEENVIDRPTAENTVGEDIVRSVERDGTVTVSTDTVVKDTLSDARLKTVDEFGEWKVKTMDGKELVGWVFPRVVDLDGTNQALSVFSNGSESAMQENISGSFVGKGTNLIDESPSGMGCFYLARQGGATAIVPMEVKSKIQGEEGDIGYIADTIMGQPVTIKLVPGLSKITEIGSGKYGIPEDCGWMPMRSTISLASNPDDYVKTAEAADVLGNRVDVMYESGRTYSMRGSNVEKLSSMLPANFIDQDQAIYNLAILGVSPKFAKEKLAEARSLSRWVSVSGTRPVKLASDMYHKAKIAAAKKMESLPQIKSLLLKEAAALDDPLSVDKVLSIGFINPENIGTFISYLPEFEDTLGKLSELLIAARLGMSSVDAGALERVVKHLDKVIGGLRELSQHPQA